MEEIFDTTNSEKYNELLKNIEFYKILVTNKIGVYYFNKISENTNIKEIKTAIENDANVNTKYIMAQNELNVHLQEKKKDDDTKKATKQAAEKVAKKAKKAAKKAEKAANQAPKQ